jgi:cell division GTPase FtsZ
LLLDVVDVQPGLINLDFADVQTITSGPGWGLMGSGMARNNNATIAYVT